MRLLIDSHIFIGLARRSLKVDYPKLASIVADPQNQCVLSVASIWEITIKVRLGKLDAGLKPDKIEVYCDGAAIQILPISLEHAVAQLSPEPQTRDPFDRMLIWQAVATGHVLVSCDRKIETDALPGLKVLW